MVEEWHVLRPDVVASALDKNLIKGEKIIYLSPKGKKFDQKLLNFLVKKKKLIYLWSF